MELKYGGGEIRRELTDKIGVKVCKELLGVGRGVSNEGVLDELGRVHAKYMGEKGYLMYAWQLKWCVSERLLQRESLMIETSEWRKQIESRMNELGLNDIWEEEGKSQFVKRRIKETLIDQGKKEMLDKITGMKSLKFYSKIREIR